MTLDAAEKAGVPVVLVRTAQSYRDCQPNAVASGSKAQMMYFVEDAKADIATLLSTLDTARAEIERLGRELEHFTKSGIVEVSIRNPSVADYMRHWEGRVETAESALTAAQARIAATEKHLSLLYGLIDPLELTDRVMAIRRELNAARATLSPAVKEPK